MFKKFIAFLFLFFFIVQIASAQLSSFTLTVTKTDETCTGNGTLTFDTSGVSTDATIIYKTYKLPNNTTPIASQSTGLLTGLVSGNYLVIATQTLNGNSNTEQQEITIDKLITPLVFTVSATGSQCIIGGTITVAVSEGNAAFFEILSGPITRPLQSSNIFTNVPAGAYQIRVFDNCGEALVQPCTVISTGASLQILAAVYDDVPLPSCNSISIKNTIILSGTVPLAYPLTFLYTIYPPDNSTPIIVTQTINSGNFVTATIPFYIGQAYTYTVSTTDPCGEIVTQTGVIEDGLAVLQSPEIALCGQFYLKVFTSKFLGPYTMEFLTAPQGFDPAALNANYPTFSDGTVKFGSATVPVPSGIYSVKITDACGNIATHEIELMAPLVKPSISIIPENGCTPLFANVNVSIPPRSIVSAQMIDAPPSFPLPLPADLMPFYVLSAKTLVLNNLVSGDYVVQFIDDCGEEHTVPFTFALPITSSLTSESRPDCDDTTASFKITANGGNTVVSVNITAAPELFEHALPYNAAAEINAAGAFIYNTLPQGDYTLLVVDSCGKEHTVKFKVQQQIVLEETLDITRFCGAFKLRYTELLNSDAVNIFYLQRLNPITNTWGHPLTSVVNVEGTPPNSLNSMAVISGVLTNFITTFGDFRLLKVYNAIGPPDGPPLLLCFNVVKEFTVTENFSILDVIKVSCDGSTFAIQIITDGIPPFTYKIIEKNGVPFIVDNGESNIFLGLEPAIYKFQVQQSCGNIVTQIVDVVNLPEPFDITKPDDIVVCDDADNDNQYLFDLSLQNAAVLGSQNPNDLQITYHSSLANAQAGTNALPFQYLSSTKTIYVRLKGLAGDCYKTTSFEIIVKPYPKLTMKMEYALCDGNPVTISADAGMNSYLWSTGETTSTISVTSAGIYTLEVTKKYGTLITCPATYTIVIKSSSASEIASINTSDWTFSENTITVVLLSGNPADYHYSLDNITYQVSNTFSNLKEGSYEVFVKNIYGCGIVRKTVHLLNYPHFFTPNGDGINDTWHINFAKAEPNIKVYIFDRYGKLIKELLSKDYGWDGTLNGKRLPSTDYWFMVQRENGQEFRGHFSMKR
ncbi:T9SS type B sorting domain-containing protein [Flavobacterium ardleyense]|uniref:T9SS type B sorting domain-containing protein n=1 Tax=Flavobacterium ardleyense TaxID=2038737 RepID=UPI00298CF71E|nr:T9SS type B sorting domain-containing protein [Flavobacterium ardleyense]